MQNSLLGKAMDGKCMEIIDLFVDKMSPNKVDEIFRLTPEFRNLLYSKNSPILIKIAKMNSVDPRDVIHMIFEIKPLTHPDNNYEKLVIKLFDIYVERMGNEITGIDICLTLNKYLKNTIFGYSERYNNVKHILSKLNKNINDNETQQYLSSILNNDNNYLSLEISDLIKKYIFEG